MNLSFHQYQSDLKNKMVEDAVQVENYQYFLKGDISGIQDFIFDVKSERAARVLKGRSFFIQAISEICVQLIKAKAGAGQTVLLYNGGGNFYMLLTEEGVKCLDEIREIIEKDCKDEELYLCLSYVRIKDGFGTTWGKLHEKSSEDKLKKFNGFEDAFQPFEKKDKAEWVKFTSSFINSGGFTIEPSKKSKAVNKHGITFFGNDFFLSDDHHQFEKGITNKLPRWTEDLKAYYQELIKREEEKIDQLIERLKSKQADKKEIQEAIDSKRKFDVGRIIEFEYLAKFAKERTGTDKLGILKMDIDNLGLLFQKNDQIKQTQSVSIALAWFFEEFINHLLDEPYGKPIEVGNSEFQDSYRNNIYVVFSGGDDCFMLGAWDAIFEFAIRLNNEFSVFGEFLQNEVKSLICKLTLSAGLLVVDSKFPVVRFAQMAEDAISDAKKATNEKDEIVKNSVSVFGQVLSWREFEEAQDTSSILTHLIKEKDESRAILERIKRSAIGFEKAQDSSLKGEKAAIWRLYYYLRNVRNRKEMEKIIKKYTNALIAAFNQKKATNPMVFPVAARWAEFLTKKTSKAK